MLKKLTYEKAVDIAIEKHKGVIGRDGKPFVDHVIRVSNHFSDETLKIIAVWHDLLEDTNTTISDLKQLGASDTIIDAIVLLTHDRNEEPYMNYIKRLSNNICLLIKMVDIEDNYSNICYLTASEQEFLTKKYSEAREFLKEIYRGRNG